MKDNYSESPESRRKFPSTAQGSTQTQSLKPSVGNSGTVKKASEIFKGPKQPYSEVMDGNKHGKSTSKI